MGTPEKECPDHRLAGGARAMCEPTQLSRAPDQAKIRGSWGRSSAGRAPRSQCGGRGFDPLRLHHSFKGRLLAPLAFVRYVTFSPGSSQGQGGMGPWSNLPPPAPTLNFVAVACPRRKPAWCWASVSQCSFCNRGRVESARTFCLRSCKIRGQTGTGCKRAQDS